MKRLAQWSDSHPRAVWATILTAYVAGAAGQVWSIVWISQLV